jgi:hypothetical protein
MGICNESNRLDAKLLMGIDNPRNPIDRKKTEGIIAPMMNA